jgi:LuxR family maltose regulon positive regulatory protein
MTSTLNLAKLTRPTLFRALARERLFRRLDRARERQVIWIAAPPGAGKTTLVSTYLECRKLPALWYQVDSGDADPASFFYYLGAAVESLTDKARLPLLAPEYLSDLAGFSRRFFRELFQCLPRPCALVLDNYHAVPLASVLHSVMHEAMQEVPADLAMIVTSRHDPPVAFARLQLSRALSCLSSEDLQIDRNEAREIAALEGLDGALAPTAEVIWERSGGWAAGYILMLEHHRAKGGTAFASDTDALASRRTLFNYFAVEIFHAAAPETQHLLLRTAFLPFFSVSMAEAISGDLDAGRHLDELYRMRYFIDRRDDPSPAYNYHALFCNFLRAQAKTMLIAAEYLMLQRRSARLLELNEYPEDAFSLYVDTRDWNAAARLIRQQAHGMIQQGRWQTVISWLDALPPDVRQGDPWLLYWHGACETPTSPTRARIALEAAYRGLHQHGDAIGQVMAVSAILETYYFEWAGFHPLDKWIDVLVALLADDRPFPSFAVELHARSSLVAALLYRQPQHPRLRQEAARTFALLESDVPASGRCTAGTVLLNCYCFLGNLDEAGRVVSLLRAHLEQEPVTPMNQVWWRIATAYYLMQRADHEAARETLEQAAKLAHDYRLSFIEPAVLNQQVLLALTFGDIDGAGALLAALEPTVKPSRCMDVALSHSALSWYKFMRGDLAAALRHCEAALENAFHTGAVAVQSYCLVARAQLLIESGAAQRALSSVRNMRLRGASASSLLEFDTLLIEADAALHIGDATTGLAALRAGLALGRQQGYVNTVHWHARMMSRLLCHALEEGIEVDYAAHLVRVRGLLPAMPDNERWPWPIKLHTLERFSVTLDAMPLKAVGKARAKPLELLKVLIAFGGRDVAGSRIAAELWPDIDGDAAQNTLGISLYRLRKLLQHDEALILHAGKLSLNRDYVWLDVWAFERLVERLEHADAEQQARLAEKFFNLYRGNFLQCDAEEPWMVPLRERLREKFLRRAIGFGLSWEAQRNWDRAALAYQHGLDVDNLSEELYRGLIRCHRQRGENAAAINAYRRCRQMLSVVLSVKPSAETEAVYRACLGS